MNTTQLPEPTIVDALLGAFDHHAFGTLAVIMILGLAVIWKVSNKTRD